jgi:hypothetical protein
MAALLEGLDNDSLLAVGGCSVTNVALGEVLAPTANLIGSVGKHSDTNYVACLTPFVGRSISSNLFEELASVVSSLATQSVPAVVELKRGPWMSGTTLGVVTNSDPDQIYWNRDSYSDSFSSLSGAPGSATRRPQARVRVSCRSAGGYQSASWTVDMPVTDTNTQATGEAESADTRMESLMSRLGVSVEGGDVPPEMLAKMAEAMAASGRGSRGASSEAKQKKKLLDAIEKVSLGTVSPLTEFALTLTIQLPKGAQEAEEGEEIDTILELNLEEL